MITAARVCFSRPVPINLQERLDTFETEEGWWISELETGRVRLEHWKKRVDVIVQGVPYVLHLSVLSEPAAEGAAVPTPCPGEEHAGANPAVDSGSDGLQSAVADRAVGGVDSADEGASVSPPTIQPDDYVFRESSYKPPSNEAHVSQGGRRNKPRHR